MVPTRRPRGPSPLYRLLQHSLLALACPAAALAQPCNQALPTGNLTGVLNTYYPGAVGTAAAGSTTITVDTTAIRGASTTPDIVAGDMLLVIQMQDAEFEQVNNVDYGDGPGGLTGAGSTALNNSGRYEYVEAEGPVSGAGVITIRGANIQPGPVYGLLNSYTTAPRDDAGGNRRGQRTFQVVRVARRASGTLTAGLAVAAWNGRTGGILAVDVAGDLALGGVTVSVDGTGFRGGIGVSQGGDSALDDTDYMSLDSDAGHGRKAEGIACTPDPLGQVPGGNGNDGCPRGDRARGAPGNGGGGGTDGDPSGGNDENTGGGGGGNGGVGGLGGNSWNSNEPVGGRGGAAFPATAASLVMGGGGGAGTSNNLGPGTGSAGGGMIFMRTGTVSGTGTLSADGADAACSAQDGGGGAGAGGSVVFFNASGALTGLTVTATGGRGGDADFSGACNVANSPHGPGGGGGGGVVFASSALNAASSVVGGQSGRTAGNIAYGSTAGANGSIATTLAVTSIPGVQACTVATHASLAGLRVRRGLVEFATASQRDTLAFQVYATADPAGRRGNRPLHARPLPAPLPDTLDAVLYRVPVKQAVGPYVLVEEIETSGRRRALGPFPVGDPSLREAFERLEMRAARERTRTVRGATILTGRPLEGPARRAAAPTLVTPARGSGAPGVKVETRGKGTATVTLADLAAAGLPPGPPETIRVFHLGRLLPHRLLRARGGAPTAIAFEAQPLATDYTDRSPHVVWRAAAAPPAPALPFTRSGPRLPAGWQRIETNAMYGPFLDLESDPWVWDFLLTGLPTPTKTFALPELLPGADPVPVRVHFAGSSAHHHKVRAALNGVPLGAVRFTGRSHGVLQGSIPRALLHATGNELAIDYEIVQPTDPPGQTGVAFFDAIDLGALPAPVAGQAAQVARIAPYDPSLPDLSVIDYLALTHADFGPAAARLASWHAVNGRLTDVVDVERAFDAFAGGAFEAQAVRGLLQRLKPGSLVVLFGDDTLDPRDYLGLGSVSYVPSLMAWDGQFGRVASENRFADQDGDGAPDLAIGRLPASTAEQAETLVDKIQAGGPAVGPGSTHVVAIDDHGPSDVPFRDVAERIAGSLPLGTAAWVDVADGIVAAREALFTAWSQGPVAVQYFGHSGVETWADEHLLTPADAAGLANIGPPPVVFSWTCQAQWYQYHLGPSVNEALLQAPQGGALATFGPTGISDPGLQALLAERVLAAMVKGLTLGESVRQAKAEVLLQHAGMQGVVDGFTLLGDPAQVVGGLPPTESGREQDP